jgi:hypothetical protein
MITFNQNLAAFIHVKMEVKNKEGKQTKGIFIPFEINHIVEGKQGGLYFNGVFFDYEGKDKDGKIYCSHILKQSFSKEERAKMTEEEKKTLPIFGSIKVGDGSHQDTVNDAAVGKVMQVTDEMPF